MKYNNLFRQHFALLLGILISGIISAQTIPQGFNYQTLIRNKAGIQLANTQVKIRASILANSSTGDVEWMEEHVTSTNQFGLVNLVIGQGTYLGGSVSDFSKIQWGNASHYLKIEVDMGDGYEDAGTSQLFSVPYALFAKAVSDSTWIIVGDNIYSPVTGNVGIGNKDPIAKLNVTDGSVLFNGHVGSTPVSGEGTRLMWIPQKAAFRAGIVSIDDLLTADDESKFWDNANIGYNSAAFGKQTQALGVHSFATGYNTKAQSSYSFVTGRYNIDNGNMEAWIPDDPLFIIGNGSDVANPSNAVTVLKSGDVGIQVFPEEAMDVNGTIRMRAGKPGLGKSWLAVSDTFALGNFRWQDPRTFNDGKWLIVDTTLGTMVNQNLGNIGIRNNMPDQIIHIGTAIDTNDYCIKLQTEAAKTTGIAFEGGSSQIWKIKRNGATNELNVDYNASTFVTVESNGEVGVGTTDPQALFHVKANKAGNSNNPANYAAIVENTSNASGGSSSSNGLAVKLGLNFPDADNNYITFFDSGNTVRGRVEGQNATDVLTSPDYIVHTTIAALSLANAIAEQVAAATSTTPCVGLGAVVCAPIPSWNVYAAINIGLTIAEEAAYQAFIFANLGVSYQSGAGDYAEWLEKADLNEQFSFGDIVGVTGGKISKNTTVADNYLVVSLSPIVLGNTPAKSEEENYEKVAFVGQVLVKVYGKVNVGDYIIPSGKNDGYGVAVAPENMTIEDYGKIVGKAWSASHNNTMNYINVAVGVNSNDLVSAVNSQQKEIDGLKSEVADMQSTLKKLLPQYESVKEELEEIKSNGVAANNLEPMEPTPVDYKHISFDPDLLMESFKVLENMYKELGINIESSPELVKLFNDSAYQQQKVREIQSRVTQAGDIIEHQISKQR